jgi:phosphatidate cytidylyltransferase
MGQRVAYGTLTIASLVGLFLADAEIAAWAGGSPSFASELLGSSPATDSALSRLLHRGNLLPFLVLAIIMRGAGELLTLFEATGAKPHRRFAFIMVAALLVAPWFSAAGWLGEDVASREGLYWPLVLVMLATLGTSVLQVLRGTPDGTFRDIGATLFVIIYLGFMGSFALQMRCGADVPQQSGVWFLLITILVTKAADIGAYFTGSAIGRTRLCPNISPAKSVEGLIGGLALGVAVAVSFAASTLIAAWVGVSEGSVAQTAELTRLFAGGENPESVPWLAAIVFGLCVAAAGQIGDLFESCLKRDAGAKDSGSLIPQYGGILDLIDSPVLAMPVAWFFLTAVWSSG